MKRCINIILSNQRFIWWWDHNLHRRIYNVEIVTQWLGTVHCIHTYIVRNWVKHNNNNQIQWPEFLVLLPFVQTIETFCVKSCCIGWIWLDRPAILFVSLSHLPETERLHRLLLLHWSRLNIIYAWNLPLATDSSIRQKDLNQEWVSNELDGHFVEQSWTNQFNRFKQTTR